MCMYSNLDIERKTMDELKETKTTPEENETPAEITETAEPQADGEYTGMSKKKAAFLKVLPMLIVLACTGLSLIHI